MADFRTEVDGLDPTNDEARDAYQTAMVKLRGGLSQVLTSEQQQQLRQEMGGRRLRDRGEGARAPGGTNSAPGSATDGTQGAAAGGDNSSRLMGDDPQIAPPPSNAEVGDPAPTFELARLGGRTPVQSEALGGKVVVLVFGSYSSPTFRDKIDQLNSLYRQNRLATEFFVVYTAEAHPAGGWEPQRNLDDKVRIEQHATAADRETQAKALRDILKLEVPILIDTMDNRLTQALGTMPNGVVVIGRDGRIAARQRWLETYALAMLIDEAVAVPSARQP